MTSLQPESSAAEARNAPQDLEGEKLGPAEAQLADEKGLSGSIEGVDIASDDEKQDVPLSEDSAEKKDEEVTVKDEDLKRTQTAGSGVPYSSFGPWQKKLIVLMATIAAFFSPFTAQIYFPALNALAKDLHVSPSKINLTMTTYMVRI